MDHPTTPPEHTADWCPDCLRAEIAELQAQLKFAAELMTESGRDYADLRNEADRLHEYYKAEIDRLRNRP